MYLEIDTDFPSHPKSIRIGLLLGNPVAWAYVEKIWIFACRYQRDGDLSAYSVEEIEGFAGWGAGDGALYAAAVKVGFIDERDGSRTLHNWDKRQGRWLQKTEVDRIRKADGRASVQRTSSGRPADVQRTGYGQGADSPQSVQRTSSGQVGAGPQSVQRTSEVPHLTSPDLTKPDPSGARAIAGSTGTNGTTKQTPPWGANEWLQAFSGNWTGKYQTFYGGGEADAKATGRLTDLIAALPLTERIAAQQRSGTMIAEFLAEDSTETVKARHCFAFFVARWNGLRVPVQTQPSKRHPNEVVYPKL